MRSGTLIHGIAASEALDSSGERISIRGLDISSLEHDGYFNYEHKSDSPGQVVGKILKAKKLFSEKDCETPEEAHFWNKAQMPIIYVMGELFDAVGHTGAQEVAAMLRYDTQARDKNLPQKNIVNFSVEGSKIDKTGSNINKSIARKVSITALPCNKMAVAEELKVNKDGQSEVGKEKNPLEFLKSEGGVELFETLEKIEPRIKIGKPVQKPLDFQSPKVNENTWWGKDPKQKAEFKQQIANVNAQDRAKAAGVKSGSTQTITPKTQGPTSLSGSNKIFKPGISGKASKITKAMTAGSMNAAPSSLTGGSAVAKEDLSSKLEKLPNFPKVLKAVSSKYPEMNKEEASAMAKYLAVRQMARAEEALEKMADLDKSKNVREQKKKKFGTDPNAPRLSDKRMKMMQQIRNFTEKRFGMPMSIAEGKRDASGKLREDKTNQPAYDVFTEEGRQKEKQLLEDYKKKGIKRNDPKPDWRSGELQTQPSPDAAIHEAAHLYLAPEGMTPAMFQEEMDRLWGESQKKYGHLKQKQTAGEIQPMAVENPIRRELGLPANKTTKPVTQNQRALDYEGMRYVEGKDAKGNKAFYDRQSRLQTPETRDRVEQVKEGSLKFHPDKGWYKDTSPDTLVNLRGRGQAQEAQARQKERFKDKAPQAGEQLGFDPKKLAASEMAKAREDDKIIAELRNKYRAARKKWDHDPLQAEVTSQPGVSDRGIEARRSDTKVKGAIAHGYGRVTDPEKHKQRAKQYFKDTAEKQRKIPKPNLPK